MRCRMQSLAAVFVTTVLSGVVFAADSPVLQVGKTVADGANPGIKISGLKPKEVVRLHALRSIDKWQNSGGDWKQVRQPLHAYADFTASATGTIDLDTATPDQGTYTKADPLALLRTGYRFGDPALKEVRAFPVEKLKAVPQNQVNLSLEQSGELVAEASFQLLAEVPGLKFEEASGPGWHAVYAYPKDGTKLTPVITLHGSEGGSAEKARGRAAQFAGQGFATLAINYFTYPHEAIKGIPTKHKDIPLELISSARDWLKARPEVEISKLSLYGVSKGAEFALLAATQYDWIASVVAVVPSDIVWEGYGEDGGQTTLSSSWSLNKTALPYVPLFSFDPKKEGLYRTNTERYDRSRAFHADRLAAARIPVEKAKARILLLASDRDEVWSSGAMTRNLADQMAAAKKSGQLDLKIYAKAGHQIAGTGTFPVRLYGEQSAEPEAKDILAEGEAAADAWRRTVTYLK
jgi:dienelactone hydrolase